MDVRLIRPAPETIGDLLRWFYRQHRQGKTVFNPLKMVTNPKVTRYKGKDLVDPNTIWVIYEERFLVKISEGESVIAGPHPAKLLWQESTPRVRNIWIGTAQVMGNFYDKKIIRQELRRLIREQRYFVSEKRMDQSFITIDAINKLTLM